MADERPACLVANQYTNGDATRAASIKRWPLRGPALGISLGLASAVFYTAANICLRRVVHCDPLWVSGIKALPTVLIAAPFMGRYFRRHGRVVSPAGGMAKLIFVSVAVQLLGNGLFQWSLGILGLALAIPLTLGGVLVGSAVIGQLLLGERVSAGNIGSILILMVAVIVLSLGAADASAAMQMQLDSGPRSPLVVIISVLGICLAGVAFSVLGAIVRQVARDGMPVSTILVTNGVAGVVVLCGIALARNPQLVTSTELIDWNSMLGAGGFNAVAFCALTGALKNTRLLYVNALNVTQLAMAAVAGVVLFSEPTSPQLLIGVVLTGLGILVMGRKR